MGIYPEGTRAPERKNKGNMRKFMIRLNPDISSILEAKAKPNANERRGYEDHEYQRQQEALEARHFMPRSIPETI